MCTSRRDATGAIEGQRVCKYWTARVVFEQPDLSAAYQQYTDTGRGTYWCTAVVDRTPGGSVLGQRRGAVRPREVDAGPRDAGAVAVEVPGPGLLRAAAGRARLPLGRARRGPAPGCTRTCWPRCRPGCSPGSTTPTCSSFLDAQARGRGLSHRTGRWVGFVRRPRRGIAVADAGKHSGELSAVARSLREARPPLPTCGRDSHEGTHLARQARRPRRGGPGPAAAGADGRDHQGHLHRHLRFRPAPLRDHGAVPDARRHPRPRADGHRRGGRLRGHPHQARRPGRRPVQHLLRQLLHVQPGAAVAVRDHAGARPRQGRGAVRLHDALRRRPRRPGRVPARPAGPLRPDQGERGGAGREVPVPLRHHPDRLAGR